MSTTATITSNSSSAPNKKAMQPEKDSVAEVQTSAEEKTIQIPWTKAIRKMCGIRSMHASRYLVELAEADAATTNLDELRKTLLPPPAKFKLITVKKGGRRKKLTEAQENEAIRLLEVEGLTMSAVAKRFNVGRATIQRLSDDRKGRHDSQKSEEKGE